jgi:hypothetical protein
MKWTSAVKAWDSPGVPVVEGEADRSTAPKTISIECHENEIPDFVEEEMERLYESIYSSLLQYRVYKTTTGNTSTYVVREDLRVVAVFLFIRERTKVRVLNEVIRLDESEISRFAEYIFAAFKKVTVISFHAIQTDIHKLRFPYQQFNCSEDLVLTLPATEQEYLVCLGKHSRKNIKYYRSKLQRDYPTFRFDVLSKEEITHQQIREIVILNRHRMAGKHKLSAFDDEETDRIISLVKECGVVGVATINGKICAGAICVCIGKHYFMSVISHDSQYDQYRLGTLCCFLTICESIARGGEEFHFLWGEYEYKYTLMGVKRNLDHVNVYRSRMQFLLNANVASRAAWDGYVRRTKLWLRQSDGRSNAIARMALNSLRHLQKIKQGGMRLLTGRR